MVSIGDGLCFVFLGRFGFVSGLFFVGLCLV